MPDDFFIPDKGAQGKGGDFKYFVPDPVRQPIAQAGIQPGPDATPQSNPVAQHPLSLEEKDTPAPPETPWPEWFQRGLETAHKWGIAPFEKAAAAVGQTTKEAFQLPGQIYTGLEHTPETLRELTAARYGQAPQVPKETLEQQAAKEHPYVQGVAGGAGELLGGAVGDPRNWPFFGSGVARPLLQRLISGGFGIMMTKGAIDSGKQLMDNWDNLSSEQRAEELTKLGGSSLMAMLSSYHAVAGGEKGAKLTPNEAEYLHSVIASLPEDQRVDMSQAMASHISSIPVEYIKEGESIGSGYLYDRSDLEPENGNPIGHKVAEVGWSEMNPDYRGKGMGTQLYTHMANVAAENGYTRLVSDVNQSPEAIRLWESMVKKGLAFKSNFMDIGDDGQQPYTRYEMDMRKALGDEKYDKLIGSKLQQVPSNAPQPEGQPVSDRGVGAGTQALSPSESGEQAIPHDTGTTGREGSPGTDVIPGAQQGTDGGQASQRELTAILPEFTKLVGGGEGEGAHGEPVSTGAQSENEPPPPVISRAVDDDLAASGINVVRRGEDIGMVSRFLLSFNETARRLNEIGHPLGPVLKSMAGIISDVTKNIAVNQTDTIKAFINGAQKLVSREEWTNQVVPLMDRQVTERPPNVPDNVWNAYQAARGLDEALRLKIINAKRSELRLNGFTQDQAETWYPDTWGRAGEHYPHLHPGTWTITRLAEVDESGNEVYEPISHPDISWRATSEMDAKKAAQAYLQAHPGEQLRVRQDTVSLPGSGITDRTRLRELNDKIREATTTIVDGGADPKEVLRQLYDQSGAAAYGPRNPAKRQFGPALQRETNLEGWTKDIQDFKDYLLAGERYVNLAPARQMLMKARNGIAQLAGMPQVQKISEFPAPAKYFSAAQYGNILGRVDSAIEGLEGHPGAWDAGARYVASGMGLDPDFFTKAARPIQQVVALMKLGFQPARILSHGLQTLWAVYPVLGEVHTPLGIAHAFDPKYDSLIHDLAVTHSGNMSDIEGLREYAGAYFGRGSTPLDWAKGSSHIIRDLGLMPFSMGIDFTRRVAAVGGYLQGLDRGLPEAEARSYARDVMDRTTGMYNAADNATALRQLPGPVSQFKGFMLKTLQFMTNLRGPEIARFAGVISLMGVVGFPAIGAMSNLVEQATGYNPENDLKRHFPVASRGAFGALGVDQPSSVGFADWFASRPGIPLGGVAGPGGSDILNFGKAGLERFKGPSREAEQDLDLAIRQLSPEGRRIWDEAIRGTSTNPSLIDPRTGATIIKSLTPIERLEAVAGFTPLRVAEERESHEYIRNELTKAKDQRGYFVDKLAENQLELMRPNLTASQKADLVKETADLQKLAIEYNQAHNLVPAVRDRIRGMMQERLERDFKKAPKVERPMIQQEMQRYRQENQ